MHLHNVRFGMSYLMITFNKALYFIPFTTHSTIIWNKKTQHIMGPSKVFDWKKLKCIWSPAAVAGNKKKSKHNQVNLIKNWALLFSALKGLHQWHYPNRVSFYGSVLIATLLSDFRVKMRTALKFVVLVSSPWNANEKCWALKIPLLQLRWKRGLSALKNNSQEWQLLMNFFCDRIASSTHFSTLREFSMKILITSPSFWILKTLEQYKNMWSHLSSQFKCKLNSQVVL